MKYTVVFEKAPDNYGAYVPDLPECVAVGDTCEETERLIREAIVLHIQSLRAHNEPVPEPSARAKDIEIAA